ncbi:hypothetical protein ACROYT_G023353 [Oculina patagonica]
MEPSCIGSQICTPVSTALDDQVLLYMFGVIKVYARSDIILLGCPKRAASVDDDLAIFVQPQIVAVGSFDFDKFFAVLRSGVVQYSIPEHCVIRA